MLIDTIQEQRTNAVLQGGIRYDDLLAPLRARLSKAKVYVTNQDAVAMAASVSLSKPSSILSALPWVKLPSDSMWLEFANEDVSKAMADLGSPNLQPGNAVGRLKRTGFLFSRHPDGISFEYVHLMDTGPMGMVAELATVRGIYRLGDLPAAEVEAARRVRTEAPVHGRVKRHLDLIAKDEVEAAANAEILARLEWETHPEMKPGLDAMAKTGASLARIEADWTSEISRLFVSQALPSLLLINTRNAVAIEAGPSMERLNRQRMRRGKPPLAEHLVVKLHLTARQRAGVEHEGDGGRRLRGSLVIGHFKVRETGVFWWSPHARSGHGPAPRTTTVLTP